MRKDLIKFLESKGSEVCYADKGKPFIVCESAFIKEHIIEFYDNKKREEYGTDVTLDELKGHYEAHFMSSEHFIDLVKLWHEKQLADYIKLNPPKKRGGCNLNK